MPHIGMHFKPQDLLSEANINNDSREELPEYDVPEISKVKINNFSRPKTVTQPRKGYDKNPFSNSVAMSTKHVTSQSNINQFLNKMINQRKQS